MPAPRGAPAHSDKGLQPERTDLAWDRTTLSLVVAAAIFLRWLPHHGWFISILVAAATLTAMGISITRKRRYQRAVQGIRDEAVAPAVAPNAALAASLITLSLLGIYTVLLLPLE